METALILTGHVRSFARCKQNILNFFCDDKTDIYACTWNDQGEYSLAEKFNLPIKKQAILPAWQPNTFIPIHRADDIFSLNQRAADHLRAGWVERLQQQWYCVKKGFELLEDYRKYRVIARCRFDLLLQSGSFSLKDLDSINTPMPNSTNLYNDHFAWGNASVMKKYCNIVDYIYTIYMKYNIDISNAEEMLKFYMEEFGSKTKTTTHNINYTVAKIKNDNTRI